MYRYLNERKYSPDFSEALKGPNTPPKAIAELSLQLGADSITTNDDELERHGSSEWSSINIPRMPDAVIYPKSTNDVSKIVKISC
ncbi:hypothetical protein HBH56_162400 [Parastagonospora nodorum]|nr:hypothetical protein HBH56_162400 [Parastagonospora nodorum]KAH3931908.1 hypothetical protein HBH54_086840 [Parastagonospora nodorum]KAH3972864.1 hypothetical protein HBH51_101490 [Parastagonospora nodorum]KAH3993867.1 hypothetical protein HBI10_196210 [Parastagonospora nodorum]KAH4012956.1 hypothetical protein HBI13_185080 [Parastagonospora nodorum]